MKPYTLDDLGCELDYTDKAPEPIIEREIGAGRNVIVFDSLRRLAYQEVRAFKSTGNVDGFLRRVFDLAMGLNIQFYEPMCGGEVRAIAKSVSKWTWRLFQRGRLLGHPAPACQSSLRRQGHRQGIEAVGRTRRLARHILSAQNDRNSVMSNRGFFRSTRARVLGSKVQDRPTCGAKTRTVSRVHVSLPELGGPRRRNWWLIFHLGLVETVV